MKLLNLAPLLLLFLSSSLQANECNKSLPLETLNTLKQSKFQIASDGERNLLATKLLFCIGDPRPKIRDGIVYEGLSYWLRNDLLEQSTTKQLFNTLLRLLNEENIDQRNFTQPFAALALSEVVRVDRISPYLTDEERQKAIDITTSYMASIEDYRGFDDQNGWRHSVAHTADIFLQLAINKNITKTQLSQLLNSLVSQVSPKQSHFYTYGEPKRLAMAFTYIVLRGEHTQDEIAQYLSTVVTPTPFKNWNSVYTSNQGLAKLHNTRSFIYSILAITGQSKNPHLQAIQPALNEAIKQLG